LNNIYQCSFFNETTEEKLFREELFSGRIAGKEFSGEGFTGKN
jgi:hypothetical protein